MVEGGGRPGNVKIERKRHKTDEARDKTSIYENSVRAALHIEPVTKIRWTSCGAG